jgi:hypothetical protein
MTDGDIEALIRVEKQKAADADARAKSLEASAASRDKSGRFARAVTEGDHNGLLSTLTRPGKHAGLIEAMYPGTPTAEQTN